MRNFQRLPFVAFCVATLVAALFAPAAAQTFACSEDGQFCLGSCQYVVCTNGSPIPMPLAAGTICTQNGNTITMNFDTEGLCSGAATTPTPTPTPTPTETPMSTAPSASPSPSPSQDIPNVSVNSIVYAGSGCPAGSVSINISPDNLAFTLAFSDLVAQIGPNVDISETRRNCQLNVDLAFPQGYSYSVANFDYRGFANLEAGVVGEQKATYYFQSELDQAETSMQVVGPSIGDYLRRDELDIDAVVWSPCGANRSLNINTQAFLLLQDGASDSSQGLLTVDSLDGYVNQTWNLRWRACGEETASPTPTPSATATAAPSPSATPTATPIPTESPITAVPSASASPSATPTEDIPEVSVRSISYAGTGCPANSVNINVSPDNKAFTLAFSSLMAELGPGLSASASRSNCQLNIDLNYPQGYTFTVANIDYRGFANIDANILGEQATNYYFQGQITQRQSNTTLSGPSVGDYLRRDVLGLESEVWAPCGATRSLNINTQVRVSKLAGASDSAQGVMTVDSVDGSVQQIYNIQWMKCGL